MISSVHGPLAFMLIAGSSFTSFSLAADPEPTDGKQAYDAELVADAAARSSFAGDESPSGFKNGKFVLTDGGPNVLNVGGFIQARYIANFRQDQPDSSDDFTGGFVVQRARVKFDGTVWDKALSYNVLMELAGSNGPTLLDAECKYTFENKAFVRMGQYKPWFNREELVSDTFQLAVERSITNSVFTMGRSQGFGVGWQNDTFRFETDFTDGSNQLNTPYNAPRQAEFSINTRADWMWAGKDFKRFNDFNSFRGQDLAGMLGAAFVYENYDEPAAAVIGNDVVKATMDVTVEGDGWDIFAAALYRFAELQSGDQTNVWGVVLQGGVFVSDQTEVFARYDVVLPDERTGPDNFNSVTAGVNYFVSPKSNVFKLTGDVVYYIDATTTTKIVPAPNNAAALQKDAMDNQFAIRLQMQVMF